MIPIRFALIELVRRLEEQHHVFPSDPARVSSVLKQEDGTFDDKLWQRAQRTDSDHTLQTLLHNLNSRAVLLRQGVLLLWFVLSLFTAVGLMQTPALNFFYVLVSVLGANTLMLLLWAWWLLRPQAQVPTWLLAGLGWGHNRKLEQQALLALYREQLERPQMKWYWGKLSHQMWLASLSGLLLGVVVMLLVRQYTFSWQSTLLDQGSLQMVVAALASVPHWLGLNVPDANTVAASQTEGAVAFSKQWANLLWSSLLIYGLLPRLLAWLVCRSQLKQLEPVLPLDKPYYQRLQRLWQTQIVDSAANYQPDAKRSNTRAQQQVAQQLWAAWETPPPTAWAAEKRPVNAVDVGVVDGRSEQEQLLQRLQQTPSQLHMAVRLQSLPDRGCMRRLGQYADHAKGGMVVCLWGDSADAERLRLWQQALDEQAIAWQWDEMA